MREHGWEGGKYLIDGFPRTTAGALEHISRVTEHSNSKLHGASL